MKVIPLNRQQALSNGPLSRLYPANTWQPFGFLLLAVLTGLVWVQLPLPWAVGLVGGTAVLLLTVVQPLVGLGLALLLGPLGALENILFGSSLLDSGQLLLLITLAVWLGRRLSRRRLVLPATFLTLPLLLFLYVAALTLLDAPSLVFGFTEMLKWIEIGLIVWLVVDMAGERGRYGREDVVTWVLGMLLLAGLSQALVGIWQFGLRDTGPEHFLILGRFYRAYGTFEQPNPFGGYMNLSALLAIGALLGLIATYWRRWRTGRWDRTGEKTQHSKRRRWLSSVSASPVPLFWLLFVGGGALATTLALLFSWSRGAWLGFAAGAAVLAFFWPKARWQGMVLLLLVGLLLLAGMELDFVPANVVNRISSFSQDLRFGDVRGVDINDANYAILERLAHWQAALNMARDNLWLGVGFGNYEPAYADYALINWPDALGHAHNYYLNILAETGVLGLAAYLVFWTAVIWQTVRLLSRLDWPGRGIALGLLAAWVALSVHHLVDKLYVNNIYVHLGVMLALLQLLVLRSHDLAATADTIEVQA